MDYVKIINQKQAAFYILSGVEPIAVKYTDRFVFFFRKEDTQDVWRCWNTEHINLNDLIKGDSDLWRSSQL